MIHIWMRIWMSISNWIYKQIKNSLLTGLNSCYELINFIQTCKIIMVNMLNKWCRITIVNTNNEVVKKCEKTKKNVIKYLKYVNSILYFVIKWCWIDRELMVKL